MTNYELRINGDVSLLVVTLCVVIVHAFLVCFGSHHIRKMYVPKTVTPKFVVKTVKLKKREVVKTKPTHKKQLSKKAEESIAKIQENLDKIDAKLDLSVPAEIKNLQIDTVIALSIKEINYRDMIAGLLRHNLRLPEKGDMNIKMTLNRSGKVAKLVIVGADSESNRRYVEGALPTLQFPSFDGKFGKYQQYTFLITLSGDS